MRVEVLRDVPHILLEDGEASATVAHRTVQGHDPSHHGFVVRIDLEYTPRGGERLAKSAVALQRRCPLGSRLRHLDPQPRSLGVEPGEESVAVGRVESRKQIALIAR